VVNTEVDTDDINDYPCDDQPATGMSRVPLCCIICINMFLC